MFINELCVGGFFKPSRLIYQVYHMFFMVCNSILCYLCHTPGMSQPYVWGAEVGLPLRLRVFLGAMPTYAEETWRKSLQDHCTGAIPTCTEEAPLMRCQTEPPSTRVGSNILLDGDPQAGYPAILVLVGNPERLSTRLYPLPSLIGEVASLLRAFYTSAWRRSASRRMLMAALRSRSITAWQCPHLYTRSLRVSLVSGRSPQLLQVCEDG